MKTVEEILKSVGMDDAAIAALDAKAREGFKSVLTSAEAERLEGEKAKRTAEQLFNDEITPALNSWGAKEANLTAQRDYYKTLADKAASGGFIPEAPPFKPEQGRNPDGTFLSTGSNPVPGSPGIDVAKLQGQIVGGITALTDLQWKYRKLTGEEMPDSPTALLAEAEANRMPFPEWADRKYDFAGKEKAIADKKQKEHDDAIRKEEREIATREAAEKYGSNPHQRQGVVSQYSELKKGVVDGTRQDPLKMTEAQRRAATDEGIRKDLASKMVQ
jgi:hypothetical protein